MGHTDPRYRPEKREQARTLYVDEKLSVRGVAERMEISTRRAWELLHDAGVEMRPEGRPRKEETVT